MLVLAVPARQMCGGLLSRADNIGIRVPSDLAPIGFPPDQPSGVPHPTHLASYFACRHQPCKWTY
jgi:hypothetical protein